MFLSTDAGATGLNLQHASTVVNMDLPWNPALLEQRIARIHRMGQQRPVQIINLVAKGTIEEGMLSVLAFKRSLSAGILDGGASEISLGGSRLNRFMKDVESVTGHMGEAEPVTLAEELAVRPQETPLAAEPLAAENSLAGTIPQTQSVPGDPWQALAGAGAQLLGALRTASDPATAQHPWLEHDPLTGTRHLKVPLPPPETVRGIADAFSALADLLKKG